MLALRFLPQGLVLFLVACAPAPPPALPEGAGEATLWRLLAWQDERGQVAPGALAGALAQARALDLDSGPVAGLDATKWTELGPRTIPGRVRSIAFDPANASTILVASATGGIWRSLDAGTSWAPVDDRMASLVTTSIAFDPLDRRNVFAATGEGFFWIYLLQGAGIFASSDGGTTWAQLPSTANPSFQWVTRLAFSPDGATLLAATAQGIFRSQDHGATWSRTLTTTGFQPGCLDVKFHPTDSQRAVAHRKTVAGGGFQQQALYSSDGGLTWSLAAGISTAASANGVVGRIELAWHRGWTGAGAGCVYALKDLNQGTLYRSTDGGATYAQVWTGEVFGGQGNFDNVLWVDPSDTDADPGDDVVLLGGRDVWRSVDGGRTFVKITDLLRWPQSAHADHHVIVEHPGFDGLANKTVYLGNDGGVWRTDDVYAQGQLGWITLGNGLANTQLYGASRNRSGVLLAGTQDNGTLRYDEATAAWSQTFKGDGGFCASDPGNPLYHYGERPYARVFRSANGGAGADFICGLRADGTLKPAPYRIDDLGQGGGGNFVAPLVLDPGNTSRLLVGCDRLWRSNDARTANTRDAGPTWTVVKAATATAAPISAIAIDPTDSTRVWVGHNDGEIYSTTDATAASPTWTKLSVAGMPPRKVGRISINPSNVSDLLVAFGGFFTDNLWRSLDRGVSWTLLSTTPLQAPLRDAKVHPTQPSWLYVASEVGLLVSADGGTSWTTSVTPANVAIDELLLAQGAVYLVTHGRGLFRQTPFPSWVTRVRRW